MAISKSARSCIVAQRESFRVCFYRHEAAGEIIAAGVTFRNDLAIHATRRRRQEIGPPTLRLHERHAPADGRCW